MRLHNLAAADFNHHYTAHPKSPLSFAMAGKQYRGVAELYESQVVDLDKALKYYQMAVDAFENEDSDSTVDKMKLKVRDLGSGPRRPLMLMEIPAADCATQRAAGEV